MPKVLSPITDSAAAVPRSAILGAVLTGLSTATSAVITAADSVLAALGKLQAQITATNAVVNPATSAFLTTTTGVPITTIAGDFISVSV